MLRKFKSYIKEKIRLKTLIDGFCCWNFAIATDEDIKKIQIVIVHEFGDQHRPSTATIEITNRATTLARQLNVPIVLQHPSELVPRLEDLDVYIILKNTIVNKYLDTDNVNLQVAQICKIKKIDRVAFFCLPDHSWRLAKNLETHKLVPFCGNNIGITYDSKCGRFSNSYRWFWRLRELIIVRPFYWFTHKI